VILQSCDLILIFQHFNSFMTSYSGGMLPAARRPLFPSLHHVQVRMGSHRHRHRCQRVSGSARWVVLRGSQPRNKKARKVAPNRARAAPATTTTVAVVTQESPGVAPPITSNQTTHPTSWHFVAGADPIWESLLHWYARIHKVRGMPWQKPFDGSLDKDGRAQRAYEVRS
jgi:hypothetical protein